MAASDCCDNEARAGASTSVAKALIDVATKSVAIEQLTGLVRNCEEG